MEEEYCFYTSGGYANVYIDKKKKWVKKVLPRRSIEDGFTFLSFSTITDLSIHQSFNSIPGIPIIQRYIIDDKNISLYMPYYGKPIHKLIPNMCVSTRKAICIPILLQVVSTCIHLFENGVQHTDIKPSNIVIDDSYKATLIDFNIMSTRVSCCKTKWTSSVGTWAYASPEIVFDTVPSDTSMVWSIGMLIPFICVHHPVQMTRTLSDKEVCSQKVWQNIFKEMQIEDTEGLVLPSLCEDTMEAGLSNIFRKCTKWDPTERFSLYELYDALYKEQSSLLISTPKLHIHIKQSMSYPRVSKARKTIVFDMYQCCKEFGVLFAFCKAIALFDRCDGILIPSENENNIACACLILVLLIHGSHIVQDAKHLTNLVRFWYQDSIEEMEKTVWNVGEWLQWNIWEKSTDVIMCDMKQHRIYTRLKNILIHIDHPYNMMQLLNGI